ncbi:MAG: hypothetical protein ISR87_08140 [Candidatus Marinimicrobia bacterium]|nr:hypothetical protein [Candidatus Neomarinimicrobiota bacterium]
MLKWIREHSMVLANPLRFAEELTGTWFRFWFFGTLMTSFVIMISIKLDDPRWFGITIFIVWQFLFLYTIRRLYLMLKAKESGGSENNNSGLEN